MATADTDPLAFSFIRQVLLYATALKESVERYGLEQAKTNGSLIVSRMWNRTITGNRLSKNFRVHTAHDAILRTSIEKLGAAVIEFH